MIESIIAQGIEVCRVYQQMETSAGQNGVGYLKMTQYLIPNSKYQEYSRSKEKTRKGTGTIKTGVRKTGLYLKMIENRK